MNRIILNETSYFGAGCRSVIAVSYTHLTLPTIA